MSIYLCSSPMMLIFSMLGVGIAWASILAMPYAILAGALPLKKMGIYMGIFNFFITLPQIISALIGGLIVKHLFDDHAVYALVLAGGFMILAALSVGVVDDKDDIVVASSARS